MCFSICCPRTTQEPPDFKLARQALDLTERVGEIPINEKWSRFVLESEMRETGNNLFLLRPGKAPDEVILDTVAMDKEDIFPEVQSSTLKISIKKGVLLIGKNNAVRHINMLTEGYQTAPLQRKTIGKIEKIQLKKLKKFNKNNPHYTQETMSKAIKMHSAFMDHLTKKNAEDILRKVMIEGACIVYEANFNDTPSPLRQTFSERSMPIENHDWHLLLSYLSEDKVIHRSFIVDSSGHIMDKKRSLIFQHFETPRANQKGEVFLSSFPQEFIPIAIIPTSGVTFGFNLTSKLTELTM